MTAQPEIWLEDFSASVLPVHPNARTPTVRIEKRTVDSINAWCEGDGRPSARETRLQLARAFLRGEYPFTKKPGG